ncbi:hypothetical protein BAZSYMA_ACONTIG195233_0 [Bathymodiolus azoricus thioautotrophic gill symbiont]|uniref:Uncharacterized protein n=1 Tax=Bathymodiolus azoricus thioautotrophic gill symbiont TaxID=235205 RepID=A0A1H6L7U2_9GAMM|nr:hypothetical protein BAZSYMA_ACONTIG195233_0 [Bathymodiolus azoricus thioautotrophic gill symbiont]
MTQSFVDSSVSSFSVTHCNFFPFSKPDGSVNKLSFPVTDNLSIRRAGLILNSYPILHLQFPVLVAFEYE